MGESTGIHYEGLPPREESVHRYMVERTAARKPDAECVDFGGGLRWTWAEGRDEMYRAANVLANAGVQRGDHVLVFATNGPGWLRAWWGTVALGAAMVPVNVEYKGAMLRHVCMDSAARVAVADPELAPLIEELNLEISVLRPSELENGSSIEAPILHEKLNPWDIYTINYTSGTTGPSKGVKTTYFQMYVTADLSWIDPFGLDANDAPMIDLPLFHISGQVLVEVALMLGSRMAVRKRFSGNNYLDNCRETGVTISFLVGGMGHFLDSLPEQDDDADNPLTYTLVMPMVGDPEAFRQRFGFKKIVTSYGMTETAGGIFNIDPISNPKAAGRLLPGLEARLVDENDIEVPRGEAGELIMRPDQPWRLTPGYFRRLEETARAWRNGWFHTGDLMKLGEDGLYYFVDRNKDALRRRGENISSFEVEREVLTYPGIAEVACVAAPGELAEDDVRIFVVPEEGVELVPASLIAHLRDRMPRFMLPRYVDIVDELPRTPTMKVQKFELRNEPIGASTWDAAASSVVRT